MTNHSKQTPTEIDTGIDSTHAGVSDAPEVPKPNTNTTPSLLTDLRLLWQSLPPVWRKRFWFLIMLSFVASAGEVLSIGSLLPFLAVLTDPTQLWQWPVLGPMLQVAAFEPDQTPVSAIVMLGLLFGTLVLIASLVRWWLVAACSRFSHQVGGAIGQDIFRRALQQPYVFHLHKTSSEIIDVISTRVQGVVSSVLMAGLQLLTNLIMVMVIAGVLVWFNPVLAFSALGVFTIVYGLIYVVTRHKLKSNSQRMSAVGTKRFQLLQEGIGGIRDIYIDGTHEYFVRAFTQADNAYRQAQSQNNIISASPRYLVEGLGTLLLAVVAVAYAIETAVYGSGTKAFTNILPMLGVLVLSAQRLLPMLHQIYAGLTSIRGIIDTLHIVRQWAQLPVPIQTKNSYQVSDDAIGTKGADQPSHNTFEHSIELKEVSFFYQTAQGQATPSSVFEQLNVVILKGQTVGLFGTTGAGKSTLLDLLMGLLEPTRGQLIIDGKPCHASHDERAADAWRLQIAHVPQHIFLSDASIASNIAFGLSPEFIDHDRVKQVMNQAQLSAFIDSLPQGADTLVGERGVRLSGGQRQRIGIARALYKSANLLVLDEATSALDPETEEAITQSLATLKPDLTIVMVSHRPSALKHCDVIYRVEQGRLVRSDFE